MSEVGEEKEDDDDGEIVGGVSRQSSFMASSASGAASVQSASSSFRQNKHPPTHMTPMSRLHARWNNSPQSPGRGDRIGSRTAVMMMNQSAD